MKKNLFILLLAFSLSTVAQEKLIEGIVSSKMVMSSSSPEMQAQLAMIGEINSITYFKNNKTRTETTNPMTGETVNIIDSETMTMLQFMSNPMIGKQYAINPIEPSKEDLEKITITKGDETKTILGYECQEYNIIIKQDGAEVKMDMYSTEEIQALNQQTIAFGKEYKGYPMQMTITVNQMGMEIVVTTEATEVKKEVVTDEKFDMTPPEGYKKVDKLQGM